MQRGFLSLLWLGVLAAVASACGAGPVRQLHSVAGDVFTLFPEASGAPPPLQCKQESLDERYACFAQRLRERAKQTGAAGGFLMMGPDALHVLPIGSDTAGTLVTSESAFPIGSMTKMFVGAAAASLSEDGLLDLHAPIAAYMPELSGERGVGRASLHQLLTHTAGLPNPLLCDDENTTAADLIARYGSEPLWAPPGAVYNYSNLGYVFAGAVLERVAAQSLPDILRVRVLEPAGMSAAGFDAVPEGVRGQSWEGAPPLARCPALTAPGGLVLSLHELGRWLEVLRQPEASKLPSHVMAMVMAPHVFTYDRPGAAYGYGVASFKHGAATWFSHAGALDDFAGFIAWCYDPGFAAAAVLNNRQPPPAAAVFRAASTFVGAPLDWAPPHRPNHPLEHYVGTYRDVTGRLGTLEVKLEQHRLVIDYPLGPPPLLPAQFSFAYTPSSPLARYVVTAVGVAERELGAVAAEPKVAPEPGQLQPQPPPLAPTAPTEPSR